GPQQGQWKWSDVIAFVGDDPAIVWQAAWRDQLDPSAQLADRLKGRLDGGCEAGLAARRFRLQRQHVLLAVTGHDCPQPPEFAVTASNLGNLAGIHEHALDLGGLIGATHPAADTHVGTPARAWCRDGGR